MPSDESLKIWLPPPGDGYQAQRGDLTQKSETWRFCLSCAGRKLTLETEYKVYSFRWTLDWLNWLRP